MSFDVLGDVNWLAIVVATLLYFALGAAWYAPPVLGTVWMRSIGWDESQTRPQPSAAIFAGPLVAFFVEVIAIAMLAQATGSDTVGKGVVLGLVVGIGIAAALFVVTAIYDPMKPNKTVWFLITAGYHFIGLMIASVLVSAWN